MFFQNNFLGLRRFPFTTVSTLLIISIILSGCAPKAPRVYRVGILSGLNYMSEITDGFVSEMKSLGYVEGKNIVYDIQKTDFDLEAYRRILHKFIQDRVDLIFVFPTEATIEAKIETQGTNVPVVFTFALIEDMNIVDNLREPGGNVTGVRYPGPDVALKRFEVMMELLPSAKTILIPYQRGYPIVASQMAQIKPAADAAGVTLIESPAENADELKAILSSYNDPGAPRIDGILLLAEPLTVSSDAIPVLCDFSYENKVPIGGALLKTDRKGSVFGINVKPTEAGRQGAALADRVLRGTPPGRIPVTSSESFLQFNYNAAEDLGIVIPPGLLKQADEVVHQ